MRSRSIEKYTESDIVRLPLVICAQGSRRCTLLHTWYVSNIGSREDAPWLCSSGAFTR